LAEAKVGVRGKLFAISLLLIVGAGLATGTFFESRLRDELRARMTADLLVRARTAATALSSMPPGSYGKLVRQLRAATGSEVSVVGLDGNVLAASSNALPGDGSSPEIEEAKGAGSGTSRRTGRDGREMLAVAVRFPPTGPFSGVLRLSVPIRASDTSLAALRSLMWLAALVGLVVAVIMSGIASELMARSFRQMIGNAVAVATGGKLGDGSTARGDAVASLPQAAADLDEAVGDLAGERDRLETILERMTEAVIALDGDDRISIANNAAFDVLGFDDDDVGRPLLDAVPVPMLLELAKRATRLDEAKAEFELPTPPHRIVLAEAAPLRTMGGVVIVMHDVTEVRRLERMRRDFVANVSHELRTPLAVLQANAETLLDGALDDHERAPTFVEAMQRNAERLGRIIADLLDLSRIEAGQYATHPVNVPVASVLDATLDSIDERASQKRIEIAHAVDPELNVYADGTALGQVLQNLIDNAIKYTPAEGHVAIRAERRDDRVRIEVEDDGPGIEPRHRRRVFERFYRVDAGRSRQVGGTGLGLSIVRHLSEQMSGTVGVEPAPGGGSIFWVELPTRDAVPDAIDVRPTPDPPTSRDEAPAVEA
jgi:two-component system, OmpR family, phosphate regulon sensor histidine kinase PhoR